MFLVINADKGSYDRPIKIYKPTKFSNAKEAGDYLKNILCGWLRYYNTDEKLLEKLNYNYDEYDKQIRTRILKGINKQIERDAGFIMYSKYDSYEFESDNNGNLTMITKGCPSDNEYDGETYQVIEIKEE